MTLEDLQAHAQHLGILEQEIEDTESRLARLKEVHRNLTQKEIPEAFASAGVTEVRMNDLLVKCSPFYSASCKTDEAFQWLEDNGFGGIVNQRLVVEDTPENRDMLQHTGVKFSYERTVHPSTLKAFVREQVESGRTIPADLFNLYIGMQAKLKKL